MKKLVSMVLLVCIVSAFAIAEKTVAVATFDVVGNAVSKDEAETITELYIAELVATGKVVVTDRANFSKLLAELKFQGSDWSDATKTIKLGNALNAEVISRGKIMKLGNKLYISATLIEAKTAKVLSSSKTEITDLGEAPNVLVRFAKNVIDGLAPVKIGDIGPGGGFVFYIEGNKAFECSELLGEADWWDAKTMCKEYRGGGYSDWYLPPKDQLRQIYVNLRKTGKIAGNTDHWSSSIDVSAGIYSWAWARSFEDGYERSRGATEALSVRAVRSFYFSDDLDER